MNSLTEIGVYFSGGLEILNHNSLPDLNGLNNITTIGGELRIERNSSLLSLSGLENLNHLGDYLIIRWNDLLSDLYGIRNIAKEGLTDLYLKYNPMLTSCSISCVCYIIDHSPKPYQIVDNKTGCNTIWEIDSACNYLFIDEADSTIGLSINPNPASTSIALEIPSSMLTNRPQLAIYNAVSMQVLSHQVTDPVTNIDISGFPKGIYFVRVTDERGILVGKFIKQ